MGIHCGPQHAAIFLADEELLQAPIVRSLRTSRLLARPQEQHRHGRNAAMRLCECDVRRPRTARGKQRKKDEKKSQPSHNFLNGTIFERN